MGEFKNGLKDGIGKHRMTKNTKTNMYEGQYEKDKKEGFGIYKWASGNIYIGQYKSDEREGIGEMKWIDGSIYIGQWERGIQNGYGIMIFPDGTKKQGIFKNNIYQTVAKPSEIPGILRSPDFDVMSLCPPGLTFTEEILHFNITARPQYESDANPWLPAIVRSKSENKSVAKSKPVSSIINLKKSNNPKELYLNDKRRDSKTIAEIVRNDMISFRSNSNSYASLKQSHSNKDIKKKEYYNEGSLSPSRDTKLPTAKLRKVRSKKIWVPSGAIHNENVTRSSKNSYY